MSSTQNKESSSTASLLVLVLSTMGSLALVWLISMKFFPDLVPGLERDKPSEGVVILDVAGYLQSRAELPEDTKERVWQGASGLARDLARQGYVVIQPQGVIDAPDRAYVPNALIDQWVSAASEDNDSLLDSKNDDGDLE